MTRNISTAPILKTQDLIMTIMTGCIVHSRATNQVRQAVRPRHQVVLDRQHQIDQVLITVLRQISQDRFGKKGGESARHATQTEKDIAIIVMDKEAII